MSDIELSDSVEFEETGTDATAEEEYTSRKVLGNPETPLDLTDYLCRCADGPGACEPALLNGYKLEDIVQQGPTL